MKPTRNTSQRSKKEKESTPVNKKYPNKYRIDQEKNRDEKTSERIGSEEPENNTDES